MNDDPTRVECAINTLYSEGFTGHSDAVEALRDSHTRLQVENQRLEASLALIADIAERTMQLTEGDPRAAAVEVFRLAIGSATPEQVRAELPEPYKSALKNTGGA